jgi:hypothetical protein
MTFDRLQYRDPRPAARLILAAGTVNRHVILPRVLRIARVDLPAADEARLRASVNPATAAFIGPNHPEFTTDWMLDKEIAHRVSPFMAHWASYDIVNIHPLAQRFWLALNLIANVPGGGGRAYSLAAARAGHGVLLHPEGTATWCGERIAPLVPGIATLALDAWSAEQSAPSGPEGTRRRVLVVPLIWKLHFLRDVSGALDREITRIARALAVRVPAKRRLETRFAALHARILARRARRFGVALPGLRAPDLFAAQAAFASRLIGELAVRHGAPDGGTGRWLHVVRRECRRIESRDPERARRDLALAREIDRLGRFHADAYGGDSLTQEQIAESLQQIRSSLVTRGWRNGLHNLVPVAVAPRVARARVPEAIEVDGAMSVDALLEGLRTHMQARLDLLLSEIAPAVDPFRRPNPFRGAARTASRRTAPGFRRAYRPPVEVVPARRRRGLPRA